MTVLVTGAAGFIGANFVLDWLSRSDESVVSLDLLTYAGNLRNLATVMQDARHTFVRGDIGDPTLVPALLDRHRPRAILHFAAESHVDRSILAPDAFVQTNVVGTFRLLEAARGYQATLRAAERDQFRYLHVSTDEVYGSLGPADAPFTERRAYEPNSPYAASKAASDHLVRAYRHTYGLNTLTTNCSNNYGPYHFPEKLIPLMIRNALSGSPLPVYGDGRQVRDWLYVGDHCSALRLVLERGRVGETYNIGGCNELANIELVGAICAILDELRPRAMGGSYSQQVQFVRDRPGHDRRYAIDAGKLMRELGWRPAETITSGLRKTVLWYLDNRAWLDEVTSGAYRDWLEKNYGNRQ